MAQFCLHSDVALPLVTNFFIARLGSNRNRHDIVWRTKIDAEKCCSNHIHVHVMMKDVQGTRLRSWLYGGIVESFSCPHDSVLSNRIGHSVRALACANAHAFVNKVLRTKIPHLRGSAPSLPIGTHRRFPRREAVTIWCRQAK